MKSFHLVMNIPSPYRLHATKELWRQLKDKGIELQVHYMSDMSRGHDERPLSWRNPTMDYPYRYWKDYGWGCYHFNPGLILYLRKIRPDYLVIGSPFDTITGLVASGWCPAITKCCGTEGNTKTPGKMTGLKGWLKRWAFSHYQYVDLPGHDAVRYIQMHQEMTHRKMPTPIIVPNLVETSKFRPRSKWNDHIVEESRCFLGDTRGNFRLCIIPAKLHPQKGLCEFISLLDSTMLEGWKINIFGQGALKDELMRMISQRGLANIVIIHDFVKYEDMPKYYVASDLFLLPSVRDPNPLSVIEAVNSGLPVAVTCRAGNVEEAVDEGRNGWVLPVGNDVEMKVKLKEVFSTPLPRLKEMGCVSYLERAPFWNVEEGVKRFIEGLGIK